MAKAFLTSTKMKLVFDDGVDEKGKAKTKSKTFKVRHEIPAERLKDAAQALGSLSANRLVDIEKNENYYIG